MAAKYREDIRKGVESLINCLICTDEFKNPKILPCQHTFCLPCLEKFYESYNQQRIIRTSNFPCPQCRKTVYMPNNGLDGLPNDFKIGQIQDVFDKIHITIEGQGINCDVCRFDFKRSKADSFCVQCSKYLCSTCTQNHSTNSLFCSHTTISIGTQNVDSLVCGEHKEEIKYYCTHCKIALCTVCALSKHSKHETQDVSQALDQQRQAVLEYNETLKSNLLLYEAKAESLAMVKKDRKKNVAEIKESIKKHVKEYVSKVREEENRLNDELDRLVRSLENDIDQEIDGIHTTVKGIKSLCDTADTYLVNGQSLDLINKYDKMMSKMKKCVQPPNSNLPENITGMIKFAPNNQPVLGELINEFQQGEESRCSNGACDVPKKSTSKSKVEKLTNSNGADVSIPPASRTSHAVSRSQSLREESSIGSEGRNSSSGNGGRVSQKTSSTTAARVSSIRPSTPVTTNTPTNNNSSSNSPPTADPDIFSGGATGGVDATDYMKTANPNDPKVKWRTFDNAEARDVSFLADGTVVVTEFKNGSDKLQLFDLSGNLKKCVACSSQNLIRPWGCAVNHQSGHIVVTDHGDRAVKVLDKDLSIRQVWRSLFDKPSGVAVMRTGEYVITDISSNSHTCSIHTMSGIRKREFANKGTATGQLLSPHYVIADHHDRIIITDSEQHCVKIFDTRGKQLQMFKSPHSLPMKPMGVCIDAQNNILLADQAYPGISLYSSEGKFIQHIAQLKDLPYGVAVHDNGFLAVATDPSLYMFHVPMFIS